MQSNGWIFYDSIELPHREWNLSLKAFAAAVDAAREASRAWPYRENLEKVSGVRPGDQYDVYSSAESAVEAATEHSDVLSLRWDYSQSDSDEFPESMKVRSYACTVTRGVGLTLYASSPNEAEVPKLLAAARLAVQATLDRDASSEAVSAPRSKSWRRLRAIDKIISHPIVSGVIVGVILILVGAISFR